MSGDQRLEPTATHRCLGVHFPSEHSRWWLWACFLVALYLAVGVLAWERTLIPDEIRMLLFASEPQKDLVEMVRLDRVQVPLSFILGLWWLRAFGYTDTAAKMLALLTNIPTLVLFTYLSSTVTRRWRLVSFLFAVPYLRIGSAVNLVRMYGLLLLLTVVALILWEKWRERGTSRALAAWTAVMILIVYTHYSGLCLLPAFFVVSWLYGPRRWTFTLALAVIVLSLLPWSLYTLPVFFSRGLGNNVAHISPNPTSVLAKLPFYFLSGEDPGGGSPLPFWHTPYLEMVLGMAALLLDGALMLLANRKVRSLWPPQRHADDEARWFWTTVILCGVPIALLYAVSVFGSPLLHARYVLLTLPMYWLLVVQLADFGGGVAVSLFIAVVLPWVLLSIGLTLEQGITPSRAREGTLLIAREKQDSDLILCDRYMPLGWQVSWEWTRRLGRKGGIEVLRSQVPVFLERKFPGKDLEQLEIDRVERIWVFASGPRSAALITNFLTSRGFLRDERLATDSAPVLLFRRLSPAPTD